MRNKKPKVEAEIVCLINYGTFRAMTDQVHWKQFLLSRPNIDRFCQL